MVVPPRADQQEMGKSVIPLLNAWIALNFISNIILLPILVLTFLFSKRVTKRHPTLINVCMTWILSGIYSLLLFFGGRAKPTDPEPSKALCIAQTSLLYGVLPMWSVAVFILMYFVLSIVGAEGRLIKFSRGKMMLMLGAPYFAQFCFSIATLVMSLRYPELVTRGNRFFYCSLNYPNLSDAMSIFTFIICLGITMLEVQLAMLMYRNWQGLRRAGQSTNFDLQLTVRVIVFGAFIFFGMFVDVILMFSQRSLVPDMYGATAGTIVFLVFGSQADVLRAWCFWKKEPPIKVSADVHKQSWVNLDLTSGPAKMNNPSSLYPVSLPSPSLAQIADHVHSLHARDDTHIPSHSF